MLRQAPHSDAAPAHLFGLDLPTVIARTEHLGGGLVLVVTDEVRRLHLTSGADLQAMDAIRGSLRLAVGASAHAHRLATQLGQTVELEAGDRHLPARPAWICVRCCRPWPCLSMRRRLADEFARDPAGLVVLMTLRLAEASADLGVAALPDLYDRFLGWPPTPAIPPHTR
jgi:hypothetical protein